jgi:hypothetical protein
MILAALAPADAKDHALAIDVLDLQVGDLGDTEPRSVSRDQQGAVIEPHDGGEEAGHFLGAEDDGETFEPLGAREVREDVGPPQGDVVEETQGLEVKVVVGSGLPPLLDQVEQVGADVVWSEEFGGPAEMPGEAYDAVDIDDDGARGEVAQLHVFDHAATKRNHGELPC